MRLGSHKVIDLISSSYAFPNEDCHAYYTSSLSREKSQRLKQKNNLNCRRGDRRNAKVPLSAKHDGLAGFRYAVGGTKMFAETVIHRIFYYINRAGNGYLTLRELNRGNLIAAMQHAEEEEDINKVLRFLESSLLLSRER